jgi:hypothetical protein
LYSRISFFTESCAFGPYLRPLDLDDLVFDPDPDFELALELEVDRLLELLDFLVTAILSAPPFSQTRAQQAKVGTTRKAASAMDVVVGAGGMVPPNGRISPYEGYLGNTLRRIQALFQLTYVRQNSSFAMHFCLMKDGLCPPRSCSPMTA